MAERLSALSSGLALIAGRYELVRELGTQGDTLVWEGFDSALERRVLVQLLRQELIEDCRAAERFWQAARSAARASTVTGDRILDGGTDPETGRAFVVREWPQRPSAMDDTVAMQVPARLERHSGPFHFKAGLIVLLGLIVVAGVGLLAVRSGVGGWLRWVNEPVGQTTRRILLPLVATPPAVGAQPGEPAPTPVGPPPTVAADAGQNASPLMGPTGVVTPRPTATLGPTFGVPRRIVNTDGRGVALRASPDGDRLPGRGYDEGATITAFESSGEWTRIRGSDGREGWVLSATLAP
jgi:hypothetical protein